MARKVLFVDDEPNITQSLKYILRKETYEVLSANSANEALGILGRGPVDVVVSDERMPGMSGTKLLSIIRQKYPHVVRIILTGNASLETAMAAINEGEIYRFLIKPCNGLDLAITIRQALQHKELMSKSRDLLKITRQQSNRLTELKKKHHEITNRDMESKGAMVVDAPIEDCDTLIKKIDAELRRSEECNINQQPVTK